MSAKVRVLFARGETDDYRAITTFELKSTHDLYWFNAEGSLDRPAALLPAGSPTITLTAPEGWESMKAVRTKHSYHASGRMHVEPQEGSRAAAIGDVLLAKPGEIVGPALLQYMITKPPAQYAPYTKSPERGGANVILIRVPEEGWHERMYLEMYLTPSGQFNFPPTYLKLPGRPEVAFDARTLDVDQDRLIAIRCAHFPMPRHVDRAARAVGWVVLPGPEFLSASSSGTGLPPTAES
ncbi:hypothetical protein [Rhodococcus sp. 06-1460-1B]|uniref:hypothetical protein n=1 Tax=Rhodococcus sp. 06-1460-1B TaxID=2022501 RepID=UPI000B9A1F6B|nr:hypothetical protein [Rhodococcus sp. 06-1460-1B]OZD68187.1 hypothetical protein CH268_00025 [Rhodococcus sp. 06-1460-1B]